MRIKMLKTKKGSPDGCVVNTYMAGQDYDMPDDLANVFINQLYVAEKVISNFIYVETPEQVKIEVPGKVEMETPMKIVKKPKRKRGRPKKVK